MKKSLLLLSFLFFTAMLFAQPDHISFKKGNKTIDRFYQNSYITFQLRSGEWIQGRITKIEKETFDLTVEKPVNNFFGPPDTLHFSGFHYALKDIYAMPKKGVAVHYVGNGLKIDMGGGHQHFYWIKSGWLFRAGAVGYAGLAVVNGIIDGDLASAAPGVGIAAGVFTIGWLLKKKYKLTYRLVKKYMLKSSVTN